MTTARNPVFCFTSDTDWATEEMIAATIKLFQDYGVPLTMFLTHSSGVVSSQYEGSMARHVGLHPNFLLNTTQGHSIDDVVANTASLWLKAHCYRNHAFLDHIGIAKKFYDKGLLYDSNLLAHLHPGIEPMSDYGGMLKFPIFLEDNSYLRREGACSLSHIEPLLRTPGLKIFDFHPIHIALNTPNILYYEQNKDLAIRGNVKRLERTGSGIKSLVIELLQYVTCNEVRTCYLDDIYEEAIIETPEAV